MKKMSRKELRVLIESAILKEDPSAIGAFGDRIKQGVNRLRNQSRLQVGGDPMSVDGSGPILGDFWMYITGEPGSSGEQFGGVRFALGNDGKMLASYDSGKKVTYRFVDDFDGILVMVRAQGSGDQFHRLAHELSNKGLSAVYGKDMSNVNMDDYIEELKACEEWLVDKFESLGGKPSGSLNESRGTLYRKRYWGRY